MTAFSIVFVILQAVSLFIMGSILYEFRQIERRHVILHEAVGNAFLLRKGAILLWTYVLLTLFLIAGTSAFFVFQPHLL